MPNHFHLVVETPPANLVAGMKWLLGTYTSRFKGDKGKVAIALRLRAESTVTLAWIAERLRMGTATHLAHLLYGHRRERKQHDTIKETLI